MGPWDRLADRAHEEVQILQDAASGLRGVLAVHDSRPGPALLATRLRPASTLAAAFDEAVRLAEAMTREAALAEVARGGGAAVLIGPAAAEKSRPFLSAFARILDRLDGRAVAVADSGFESRDLTVLARMTRHVGHRRGPAGDPAELTALGLLEALRVTAARLESSLDEMHVAIQGVGQVGYRVARLLAGEGARLTVADVDAGRAERAREELGAAVVEADAIVEVEADVFSPNAGSAALDARTVERLRGRAVVGAARDVLAEDPPAELLHARGVLYAPDFVVSGGATAGAVGDDDEMAVQERVAAVGTRLEAVWRRAQAEGVSPREAAERMLRDRGPR
jgi:leucine dehydrogenase